jgi:hypothetical protein
MSVITTRQLERRNEELKKLERVSRWDKYLFWVGDFVTRSIPCGSRVGCSRCFEIKIKLLNSYSRKGYKVLTADDEVGRIPTP